MNWVWVFLNEEMGKYIVLAENEFDGYKRYELHDNGFECFWDSARNRNQAKAYMTEFYPEYQPLELNVVPVSFKAACQFVNSHHRHLGSPRGMKFAVALSNGKEVIGVLIAGRPVARCMDDGLTLEITRLCVLSAYQNACSKLYAAARRIAKEMGYATLITYTLMDEPGISLKAAGFLHDYITKGGSWNSKGRSRIDKHQTGAKHRWVISLR